MDSSVSQTWDVLDSKIHSSQQDIYDSTSSSSIDAISCQPISRNKSHLNTTSSSRPVPDSNLSTHEHAKLLSESSDQKNFVRFRQLPLITPISSSSSSIPPASSLSHKRRQRAAVQIQLDKSTSVIDNNHKDSAPPLTMITNKPTAPFVKPTTKSYFYKVFQQTKDDSRRASDSFSTSEHIQSLTNKASETLGSARNIEDIGKNQSEGALKYVIPHDVTMETNVSIDVASEVVDDLTSSHPSTHHPNNGAVTFNGHPLVNLFDPSVKESSIHLLHICEFSLSKRMQNSLFSFSYLQSINRFTISFFILGLDCV